MISSVQLQAVAERIDCAYLDDFLIAELRTEFTPLHFTYCSDDDVGGSVSPVLEHDRFNLYLIDAREHCLKLTNDTETATGLVVAEIMGD